MLDLFKQIHMSKFRKSDTLWIKEGWAKMIWQDMIRNKKWYHFRWLTTQSQFLDADTVEVAKWMLHEKTIRVEEKRICFNPGAVCWVTGKSLFLRPATVVYTGLKNEFEYNHIHREKFYFSPKQYTAWLLKQ